MEIICCQPDIAWENPAANHAQISRLLDAAPSPILPRSLIALPEMFACGFSVDKPHAVAESITGPSVLFLQELAKNYQSHVVAGLPISQSSDAPPTNEAIIVSPTGDLVIRYSKVHAFTPAKEDRYFAQGRTPVTVPCNSWLISPAICYDLRFPELFRHSATKQNTEIFVVIANWPAVRIHHWITLLRARAIENQAYVAGVNRCGRDPYHEYSGQSMIVGPTGDVLAEASDQPGLLRAELDHEFISQWRKDFPALADAKLVALPHR
ncbi:MAG: carbon-nitrogen family hydrolase [Verrucomicrobiota bacterium]